MPFGKIALTAALLLALSGIRSLPAHALPADTLKSVVSVLPDWPGRPQGGAGGRPGMAPEGSGVVLKPGLIWHARRPGMRSSPPGGSIFAFGTDASCRRN